MLGVMTQAGEVRFSFKYDTPAHNDRYTWCKVQVWRDGFIKEERSAVAKCSPRDNYSKRYGRKLALSRAIKMALPDKSVRREFWDAVRIIGKLKGLGN